MHEEQIEVLETASEYIDNLKEGLQKVAEYFLSGQDHSGVTLFQSAIEGFQWLIEVVGLTGSLLGPKVEVESLNEKLQEVVRAFEKMDFVLISDILQYEIIPILEQWQLAISKFLEGAVKLM